MKRKLRRAAIRCGLFALAGTLVYLALHGTDIGAVMSALLQADWLWLLPLGVITMTSHVLRAWRWQVLLFSVEKRRISLWNTFCALMIGTMTNYALPRVGEVVRTAHLAGREDMAFSSVLGTVVVERVLDVLALLAGLLISLAVVGDDVKDLSSQFSWELPTLPILGALLLAAGLTALFVIRARTSPFWSAWLDSFRQGLRSAHRSSHPWTLVGTTGVMWFFYVLMAWIPLVMLDMAGTYDLSLADAMAIMFFGAVGVAVPLPGGVGSFHYITRVVLVILFGVDISIAVTYAVLVHGGQLILYVVVGATVLAAHGLSFSQLLRRARESRAS